MPRPGAWQPAPAKINLSLRVTGRRGDGYHLLDSLVAFADIGDRVRAVPAERLTFSVVGPFAKRIPRGGDNFVLRAARALAEAAGVSRGAALTLDKRLPVASGVGGGSADAAATLRALTALWGVAIADADLAGLALGLGADVPVCLAGRSCRMTGIGETLMPVPALTAVGILLVNPLAPCSTSAVFKARAGAFSEPGAAFDPGGSVAALIGALASEHNDLTDAATRVCPPVADVLTALSGVPTCRLARMSGSGGTCFGLFDTPAAARKATATLAGRGWWTASGRLLP